MPAVKSVGKVRRSSRVRLRDVFTKTQIRDAFKKHTWTALRRQACVDLFGYYDYNLRIDVQAEHLARTVRGGSYVRQQPIQIELTKSDLLVRRMQLPHPDEATLMTTAANYLEPFIKAAQPSKKTYYGRSDTQQRGIHLLHQNVIYPWFALWPIYQKQLLEFAKKRKLLVTTDVQNFFDSINIGVLRNKLATICGSDELPNFIVFLFEHFAVRDRYAPFRGVGIPTIDSDLPRLVAHCLLFEADEFLMNSTANSFSRWVDDLNFGVSDRTMARILIRDLERILFQQGLRLGGGKTSVLDSHGVSEYIQEQENQYLNVALRRPNDPKSTAATVSGADLTAQFILYRNQPFSASTEKVIRRYYNAFAARDWQGITLSAHNVRQVYQLSRKDFDDHPDSRFRLSIISLWLSLPPTKARLNRLLKAALDGSSHDDVVTAAVLQGIAQRRLGSKLGRHAVGALKAHDPVRPGIFYGMAWLLAKHGTRDEIATFASRAYPFWSAHELYARQVVALWTLLAPCAEKNAMLKLLRGGHGASVERLLSFVDHLENLDGLTSSLRSYLPPGLKSYRFDLYRAVLSNCILRSPKLPANEKQTLAAALRKAVDDPIMRGIALGSRR